MSNRNLLINKDFTEFCNKKTWVIFKGDYKWYSIFKLKDYYFVFEFNRGYKKITSLKVFLTNNIRINWKYTSLLNNKKY